MKNTLLIFAAFVLFFSSCKINEEENKNEELILEFKGKYNGDNFVMRNTKINTTATTANIELFKFYLSNITLVKKDGSEVLAKDVTIVNFDNNHNTDNSQGEIIKLEVETGDYTGIKFGVGVDSTKNNQDPTVYAEGQPLSVFEGMHWSWNTGYIFYKIEGRYDTMLNATGTLPRSYFYHIGLNELYETLSFNKNFTVSSSGNNTVKFTVDMAKIFTGNASSVDMKTENFTHTTGQIPLAIKVRDLFLDAISVE